MVPDVQLCNRVMILMREVFPAPFGPNRPNIPGSISKFKSFKAFLPPG